MRNEGRGKLKEVILKIDISKIYDRVSGLGFFTVCFDMCWVNWVMLCVTIIKYSIVFNGDGLVRFQGWGFHQGILCPSICYLMRKRVEFYV